MWPIIKKEIQERFWLPLVGVALFGYLHYHTYHDLAEWLAVKRLLVKTPETNDFLLSCMAPNQGMYYLFLIVFGGIIGFSLIFFEARDGSWNFLKHRCLTKNQIFSGKILSGMLIYATGTLPYILGHLYWFAAPGYMPIPWSNESILILFLPWVWGVAAMFSFFTAALPNLKHWGRMIPVSAFLALFVFSHNPFMSNMLEPSLWVPFLGSFIAGTLFILHSHQYLSPWKFRLPIWRVMVFLSLMMVLGIIGDSIGHYQKKIPTKSKQNGYWCFENGTEPQFTRNGGIVLMSYDPDGNEQFKSLLGGEFTGIPQLIPHKDTGILFSEHLRPGVPITAWGELNTVEALWSSCEKPVKTYYFWLKKKNLVVGYDIITRLKTGYLGAKGWVKNLEDAIAFEPIQDIRFVGKYAKVGQPWFWIQTSQKTILWNTSNHHLQMFPDQFTRFGAKEGRVYAMGRNSFVRVNLRENTFRTILVPPQMQKYGTFLFHDSDQNVGFIALQVLNWDEPEPETYMAVINWDGKVIESGSASIPFEKETPIGVPPKRLSDAARKMCLLPGWELYSYAANFPFNLRIYSDRTNPKERLKFWTEDAIYRQIMFKRNGGLVLIALFFFLITHNLTWKNTFTAALTLILGYPWLITLFLLPFQQGKAPCPVCKKPRKMTQKPCAHCGKEWPKPRSSALVIYREVPDTTPLKSKKISGL